MSSEPQVSPSTSLTNPLQKRPVDGQVFKSMVEASLTWLRTNQQTVNLSKCLPRARW